MGDRLRVRWAKWGGYAFATLSMLAKNVRFRMVFAPRVSKKGFD
jgi:hypothetical protein